jgi:AraC-like DNA-binding protein
MSASEVTHSPPGRGRYTRSFDCGSFAIGDYECHTGRGVRGQIQSGSTYEVVFVRRGVFVIENGPQTLAFTSRHVLLLEPFRAYTVQHPVDGGDDCTVVTLDPELLDEYSGRLARRFSMVAGLFPRHQVPVGGSCFLIQEKLRSAIRNDAGNLAIEEMFCTLVDEIVTGMGAHSPELATHQRQRDIVRRVQEIIVAHPASPITLQKIGAHVGLSRCHLARVFRRVTGCSIHRFHLSVRLRAGLQRLVKGERNLTTLALDLGFADHSHFTHAFHREFGVPPSLARKELAHSSNRQSVT